MPKPRSATAIKFPFRFEKNGRQGRIKKWSGEKFGTYFVFAGKKFRNSFGTFDAAYTYLDHEFSRLDTDRANSAALHPLNHDVRAYHEMEQLLRERTNGATLREAVEFFLVHHERKRFVAATVLKCIEAFKAEEKARNLSPAQLQTLTKHLGRFQKNFGTREMHSLSAKEISEWLAGQCSADGEPWSAKTRRNVRGSLVSLSLYSQRILNAIPDIGLTEFQKVKNPKKDAKGEVEIYTPKEVLKLLVTAIDHDISLIPGLIVGNFQGLRPDEFHAENAKRKPLTWEAFNWNDRMLHVMGQKVRSKATRDIPLHSVSIEWLTPFKDLSGSIWEYTKAYDEKVRSLCAKAGVQRRYDGFRHSYASYRIRHLKGDLAQLAEEMGNSPAEIINSYKRNVTDKQADEWFAVKTPPHYREKIQAALALRKPA